MAVPTTDARLADYSTNFSVRGTDAPADFGLDAAQMVQYNALHTSFINAYNACASGGRSKALVIAKEDHKWALIPYARELYAFIQASRTVSNENKALIGVVIPDREPTPQPPPGLAPLMNILRVVGHTVHGKLADASVQGARRRPPNAAGAVLLSFVGDTHPALGHPSWRYEGQVTRNIFNVQFLSDLPPGTKIWLTSFWYSRRGEPGPAATPISTHLHGWGAEAA